MERQASDLLASAVDRTPVVIILTDPRLEDNPITFVNDAFARVTMYSRDYAIGRNWRFLHGEDTEPDALAKIDEGPARQSDFEVRITNRRADGSRFRSQMLVSPVLSDDGELTAYFTVQRVLTKESDPEQDCASAMDLLRELQHRVKNHLAMVVSMIRVQARRDVTPESLRAVSRRVEALSLLYDELFNASLTRGAGEYVRTGAYLSRIASVLAGLEGRSAIRVNVDCEDVDLPIDLAARLGLLLSELLTNALEHAFDRRNSGTVNIRFQELAAGTLRLSVEDDGIGLPEGSTWPFGAMSAEDQHGRAEHEEGDLDTIGHGGHSGVGGTIVASLTDALGARLSVNRAHQGTIITVDLKPTVE